MFINQKQHDRVEHSRLSVLLPRETHWNYCHVGRQPFLFGNSSWPRTLEIKLEIHPGRLVYLETCSAHVRMLGFSSWSLHICLEIRSEFREIEVVLGLTLAKRLHIKGSQLEFESDFCFDISKLNLIQNSENHWSVITQQKKCQSKRVGFLLLKQLPFVKSAVNFCCSNLEEFLHQTKLKINGCFYIPLIYCVLGAICYLPPFMIPRNNHWQEMVLTRGFSFYCQALFVHVSLSAGTQEYNARSNRKFWCLYIHVQLYFNVHMYKPQMPLKISWSSNSSIKNVLLFDDLNESNTTRHSPFSYVILLIYLVPKIHSSESSVSWKKTTPNLWWFGVWPRPSDTTPACVWNVQLLPPQNHYCLAETSNGRTTMSRHRLQDTVSVRWGARWRFGGCLMIAAAGRQPIPIPFTTRLDPLEKVKDRKWTDVIIIPA